MVDALMANKGTPAQLEKARKDLRDSLVSIAPIFGEKPYFMSDEFTIVDCCVTPILWRLPFMGIELPKSKTTKPLFEYRDRLFERESILMSLSEQEKEMI
jgi:RNA polymerase-associated protein